MPKRISHNHIIMSYLVTYSHNVYYKINSCNYVIFANMQNHILIINFNLNILFRAFCRILGDQRKIPSRSEKSKEIGNIATFI